MVVENFVVAAVVQVKVVHRKSNHSPQGIEVEVLVRGILLRQLLEVQVQQVMELHMIMPPL